MSPREKIVAVMQPYFLPFPGYFRLFAAADEVVFLDCVQFPRRGFVHRNRFRKLAGTMDWLSLPVASGPRDLLISELAFAAGAEKTFTGSVRAFEMFSRDSPWDVELKMILSTLDGSPADLIIRLLGVCCSSLDLPFANVRASQLPFAAGLRGQDRILAIVEARGGSVYVNPPGGRDLYDAASFAARGIKLRFLPPFEGPLDSIGQRLHDGPPGVIREQILRQCALEPG